MTQPHTSDETPEYLADADVDSALDAEIRGLLTTCFTKAQDTVFHHRRYFVEPYPHRWTVRDAAGRLIAHTGVHVKNVSTRDRTHRIGGLCEVCVHPDHRGKGLVRAMLARIHEWLTPRGFEFAVLFGNPRVYASSGYVPITNLVHDEAHPDGTTVRKSLTALVRPLSATPWPPEEVYLPGPVF